MSDNLYAPPMAEVRDVSAADGTEFYVVGTTKFLLLFFATIGLYQVYWFYMHWARYRRFRNDDLWPVARAIFSVFFTHSLAGEIDDRLRRNAAGFEWSPVGLATAYVALTIVSNVAGFVPDGISQVVDLLPLVLLVPIGWVMMRMQRAANAACGQPDGESNRRLTWANWLWLVPGGLFWLLILVGLSLPEA